MKKEHPKTFKELFANTGIESTTDESGNMHYNFKATMKTELEEAAEDYAVQYLIEDKEEIDSVNRKQAFKEGAKWQEQKMYSEEEVYELCKESRNEGYDENTLEQIGGNEKIVPFDEWFEQNRKK